LKSTCRKHKKHVRTPPTRPNLNKYLLNIRLLERSFLIRNSPYPPSFSRIPASSMEPPTGASTWAFGSHRCRIKVGSLTMKIKTIKIHQNPIPSNVKLKIVNLSLKFCSLKNRIKNKKGKVTNRV